ncbi:NUDIX hydrolase [Roseibacterium sp. SDUM158016]|uniref:NUDIX hydrolase n=1 Tax=Roseicyclus sediminis TaxID=2980997 RepID=UPI0021D0FE43|nr:NUDIX hydrolase [Roseibacterium sp. SDUM158016]MCU4652378.1 NUDIX hydrolase [Roseibacterium sp. SDUM158016]
MNRRFGRQPTPGQRYVPRPGVYAIIDAGDGLLATFQEEPRPELQLPGGGIDPGESPQVALVREVMEETGYGIHGIRRLGMFHRFTYMPDYDLFAQKLCHVYAARLGPRRSEPTEAGHTAVFLPWETALERLAVSGDRHFVAYWLRISARGQRPK